MQYLADLPFKEVLSLCEMYEESIKNQYTIKLLSLEYIGLEDPENRNKIFHLHKMISALKAKHPNLTPNSSYSLVLKEVINDLRSRVC